MISPEVADPNSRRRRDVKRISMLLLALLIVAMIGCDSTTRVDQGSEEFVLTCIDAPVTLEAWAEDEYFVYLDANFDGNVIKAKMTKGDFEIPATDGHWMTTGDRPSLGPPPSIWTTANVYFNKYCLRINGTALVTMYTNGQVPRIEGVTVEDPETSWTLLSNTLPIRLDATARDDELMYVECTFYGETVEAMIFLDDWLMLNGDGYWKVTGTPNLGPPPPGSLMELSDEVTQAGVILNGSMKVTMYVCGEIPVGEGITVELVRTEE